MSSKFPKFIEEIEQKFEDSRFKKRFEKATGYPISIYKTDTELATAFLLYREGIKFKYGVMYPKDGKHKCEADFTLCEEQTFKPLPSHMNVVHWPYKKPVKYIETKTNVRGLYDPKPKAFIERMLKERRVGPGNESLFQREFLLSHGVETYPLGMDGLGYYYYQGLLLD